MITVYPRSDYEMSLGWNMPRRLSLFSTLIYILLSIRLFIPLFGISKDRKFRIRWLVFAIYIG